MAENGNDASDQAGSGDGANAPQLTIATQYVKDFSFENPNAPQSLAPTDENPEINVSVDVEAKGLAPLNYEVSLKIRITAKYSESTVFVLELDYAGLFAMQNIPEENLQALCLIECPRIIFPFARRIIADATRDGGFPPLLLDPIDFATLYEQRAAQMQADTSEGGERPEATN